MYYDKDRHRMVLNFHLIWGPSPGFKGESMVFYTKDYTPDAKHTDFETYEDKGWTLHRPPNSDIFAKLEGHYGTWSCTSPFLLYHDELHAAGHMKIMYQKYLDKKIFEWARTNPAILSFDAFEQYFSDGGGAGHKDHLLHSIIHIVNRVAREQTKNEEHGVGSEKGDYVRHITQSEPGVNKQKVPFALLDNRVDSNDFDAPQTMVSSPDTYRPVLQYLIHKGFYVVNDETICSKEYTSRFFVLYVFLFSRS
jgi:hypothetical protein